MRAVDDVSFSLRRGHTLGLVGESGCGKSVTALSIMRLLPRPAGRIESGRILFKDTDIVSLPAEEMYALRGNQIAMIFQEPMTDLNPVHSIGRQVGEVYRLHFQDMDKGAILRAATDMLAKVGIPDPAKRLGEYPHQISGGMRQRVMIAMALACRPDILIADEPTTALDVTIQAQILELIRELQAETGMAVIFITHDLGVVAELCDDVVVMYAGKVAEVAPIRALFGNPRHPYTRGLLSSIPTLETPRKQKLKVIKGVVPGLEALPPGCRFANRCPHVQAVCAQASPPLAAVGEAHWSACYFAGELAAWRNRREM
ncbi:MAG: ABC transporter ATP-binding protein [Desulfosarcina sp.]|nr:ABC transporter ATP-binding protein [Desulfobacterales bacterium]